MTDTDPAVAPPMDATPESLNFLDEFDQAWRGRTPPRIGEFLAGISTADGNGDRPARRERLEELIKIDLEYRWRRAGPDPRALGALQSGHRESGFPTDPLPVRPRLEDYLAHYPDVGPLEALSPVLIGEEYRVRWRWGDRPGRSEYLARFAPQAVVLAATLTAIDAELAAETRSARRAPPEDLTASTRHEAAPRVAEPARPPFDRVGRYELGELLGAGAFGSVWRAYDPELGREVAIKLPRGGSLGGPEQEERFLREARSAAQLRHPGIVAVHDTGRDRQTVYIVSELVRGVSLAQWLARGPMDFREAATLAARVADALDYAHRRDIVHRDLKPSNILLEWDDRDRQTEPGSTDAAGREPDATTRGADSPIPTAEPAAPGLRPRIVDFGLARRQAAEVTMTVEGQLLGTPAFMSPEQIRSAHTVDGRSDVYSLGVVLYQILTGELPFRGVSPMLQIQVLEDEPSPPRRLNDRIPRDLETITLKCLAKEPSRRYSSACELADDLRRFLAGEPIVARPIGRAGQLWRWCRRKPVLAGLTAALVLSLCLGAAAVTRQWLRAEANLREARRERNRADGNLTLAQGFVHDFCVRMADQIRRQDAGMTDYQRELLEKALHFYEGVALPQSRDPAVRHEAGDISVRMGRIHQVLGHPDQAEATYKRAVATLGSLAAEYPARHEYLDALAGAWWDFGLLYQVTHRWDKAEAAYREAVATYERLVAAQPGVAGYRQGLAGSLTNLGTVYSATGRPDQAVPTLRKGVAIYEALVAEDPGNAEYSIQLGLGCTNLGWACKEVGHSSDAADAFRRGGEAYEALAERPGASLSRRNLAQVIGDLGGAHALVGQPSRALAAFRKAEEIYEALVVTQPDEYEHRYRLAVVQYNLGNIYYQTGRRDMAEEPYRRALTRLGKLAVERPDDPGCRIQLAATSNNLGIVLSEIGRASEAEPHLVRSAEILDRLIRDHPDGISRCRVILWEPLAVLGKIYRCSGRDALAREAYRRARQVLSSIPHPDESALYGLAAVQAQCAVMAGENANQARSREQSVGHVDLDTAMATLRSAVSAGFKDLDRLRSDLDLDPLRPRPDFQSLLMDLTFPADPFSS